MSSIRHHTVPRFLLGDFAVDGDKGSRVCQLDVGTGRPRQVSPRDAEVAKHFYSIDIDGGARSTAVEETIGLVESTAAPLIRGLAEEALPVRERRAELALFIAMAELRTPLWRQQTRSLLEQAMLMFHTEETRHSDLDSIRAAFAGTEWEKLSDAELEAMRKSMVDDLDAGRLEIELPINYLIKTFLEQSTVLGWVLFALDWTVVRSDGPHFILGDTPVSVYDPKPKFPGSGAGPLSSPNVEVFLPLAPSYGLLAQPNPATRDRLLDVVEDLPRMDDDARAAAMDPLEGRWAVSEAREEHVAEMNLRTYAHAQTYIYGDQTSVCGTRAFARRNGARLAAVRPGPPRIHILEDHPDKPGLMRAVKVFEPTIKPGRRRGHQRSA